MAGIRFIAQTGEVSLSASTAKTVLQIAAPANQRLLIDEISVSFDGVLNTGKPVLVEVYRQTSAGSGGDALTLQKWDEDYSETLQSLATEDIDGTGGNPAEGKCYMREKIHPQGGYTWQAPIKNPLIVNGGDRIGIKITAEAAVACVARMFGEE